MVSLIEGSLLTVTLLYLACHFLLFYTGPQNKTKQTKTFEVRRNGSMKIFTLDYISFERLVWLLYSRVTGF